MVRSYKTRPNVRPRRFQMVSDSLADYRSAAYQAVRSKAPQAQARRAVTKPSFVRQLKALVASKKKEAADVQRDNAAQTGTSICCLTSSTADATAASGTGLLDLDGDECLINSVHIKGSVDNQALLDLDPAGDADNFVRMLVVWFNKPLLVASAAGTLPPITEVLVTDSILSQFVTPAANGGRFTVLSDKIWNVGNNTYQSAIAAGHARTSGKNKHILDYTVKVNKMCKFAAPSVSGTPAGHYDSDVAPGRIDKGLLILYKMVLQAGSSTLGTVINTRLNYTG